MLSTSTLFCQTIYNADFSNNDDGFADHNSSSPPIDGPYSVGPFGSTNNQWSLNYTTTPKTDTTNNSFKVEDLTLASNDWGGQATFISQSIDISTITTISINALTTNTGANDDNFTYFYILDEEERVETSSGETNNGDNLTYNIPNLDVTNYNTIQVGFEFSENGSNQGYSTSSFTVSDASSPSINFNTTSSSEIEPDNSTTISIPITMLNYTENATIAIEIAPTTTAEVSDYTLNTTTLTFTNNETKNVSLTINSDTDFEDETIVLTINLTAGTASITNTQHSITITDKDMPPIIISEIMYNTISNDDEWIELHNTSNENISIANWTLTYNENIFTFPSETILEANSYTTIAVGSNGDGYFNNSAIFTPDYNTLGVTNELVKDTNDTNNLRNTTASIELKNNTESIIDTVTYDDGDQTSTDGNGKSYEIIATTADNIATSFNWQASVLYGGSPKRASGATWEGNTDHNWTTSSNWANNRTPHNSSDIIVLDNAQNYPTTNTSITFNSLTIEADATFVTTNGSNTIGTIYFNKDNKTTDWQLVAPPVINDNFQNFKSRQNLIDSTNNSGNLSFGTFNTLDNSWTYMTNESSEILMQGKGYALRTVLDSEISFIGSGNFTDFYFDIINGINSYNLVGNPYTSYFNSGTFLTNNSNLLSEETIWIWNGNDYDTYTSANAHMIPPGEGFFINAYASNTAVFSSSNQSHNATNSQKTTTQGFSLTMSNGTSEKSTKITYVHNATDDFDNGYDASMFGGSSYDFALYTEPINNNQNKKLAIQALSSSNIYTTIIPVGVIANAGEEIIFSTQNRTFENSTILYLEDKNNQTFTNISENTYNTTLTNNLTGSGRFYIHASSKSLHTHTPSNNNNINIYTTKNNNLIINGTQEKTQVSLFSILGKEIINNSYNLSTTNEIQLPSIAKGIYIVKLKNNNYTITKKIHIK